MTTDIREICNLSEEDREARRESLNQHLFPLVRRRQELPNGLTLYFEETPDRLAELEAFVEFERVCCSGIDWSVDRDPEGLRLDIRGIDPRSPAFADVGRTSTDSGKASMPIQWPRLLRSTGFGTLGALVVCCVLPLGVVALVGATPLLLLDNPWLIGASAIGLSILLWRWEGRRQARSATAGGGDDCGC